MKVDTYTHIYCVRTFSAFTRIPEENDMSRGYINSQTCLKHTNARRVLGLRML